MNRIKLLFSSYLLILFSLFLYSFTQVDLSLTLSKLSIYQTLEKNFQQFGFYQRPQSALIFSIILTLLFIFYFMFLYFSKKNKITTKNLKIIVFLVFLILGLSYNAFSYDLFNYIFDAKIITFYHQNPYLHTALDFSNDPMLSFMRWTHRLYPYGPSWLALTVPLSFIGGNFFLFTFFLFKFMIGSFYLGSAFLIYKISEIVSSKNKIFNTIFWSLNPLVIIESLISSHNDLPLIFFGLLSFYLFLNNKKFYSLISLIFSIGVKFSTAILIPVFCYIYFLKNSKKEINWEKAFLISLEFSLFVIIVATLRTNFQPWYLLFPLSLASLVSFKNYVFTAGAVSSIFASSIYIPYVLLTDYSKNYPQIISNIELVGLLITAALFFIVFTKHKLSKR